MLERMEVALIHGPLLVEINLTHELAIIAADNIRIVFGHGADTFWGEHLIFKPFLLDCTKALNLGQMDFWPIGPKWLIAHRAAAK
jgi:hypothetical protein